MIFFVFINVAVAKELWSSVSGFKPTSQKKKKIAVAPYATSDDGFSG